MDTNKLIHFKTIYQTGNLREAAGLLGISHAGLSKSIKSLESELGTELITKDGRGIKVTKSGANLIEEINHVLLAVDKLQSTANKVEFNQEAMCKIGTFEVFSTYLAPSIKSVLPQDTNLSFRELLPGKIEDELINGDIDYGISYLPIPSTRLDHLKVTSIKMGIYSTKKYRDMSFGDLPFVIPISNTEGTPTKARGLDGWPDDRIPRKIEYTVSLMETALALARKGYAVGYFPKFVIEKHNEIVSKQYQLFEIEPPQKIKRTQDVYLIKRKNAKEGVISKKIAKILRSLI